MSFSIDAKNEIIKLPIPKKCCKTAYAAAFLMECETDGCGKFVFVTKSEIVAYAAQKAFAMAFDKKSTSDVANSMGEYMVALNSEVAKELLCKIQENGIGQVAFSCSECSVQFLRGMFIAAASVTDPENQYHLEFLIKDTKNSSLVYGALSEMFSAPAIVNRKNGVGLVYKSSSVIEDILSVIGANHSYFTLVNGKIEREIRNNENRATNCETRNIAVSVDAAVRQIAAIEKLKAEDQYDALPPALKETAEMRVLYPSLPLSELANRFAPPLTKSGLNNRLKKILELAN